MVLLTVVCWAIMRPFKRMSQTFSRNSASMVNRKARGAKQAIKRTALTAAATAVGSPAAGGAVGKLADKAGERWERRHGKTGESDGETSTRPEGRALNNRRQQALTQSRADARKTQGQSRSARLGQAGDAATERDARIAGIAAVASRDMTRGKSGVDGQDTERAIKSGASAWKLLDQDEANSHAQDRKARKELLTASVGQRWDGGDRSAIAPMKVYTPTRDKHSTSHSSASTPRSAPASETPYARIWTAAAPSGTTMRDRYI
jgi:hypothetical protein